MNHQLQIDRAPGSSRSAHSRPDSTSRLCVEPAHATDAAALARLAERTFCSAYGHFLPALELAAYVRQSFTEQRVRQWIDDPRVRLRVCRIGTPLGGYIKLQSGAVPAAVRSTAPIELERLYVDRPHQGQGLGGRLLQTALGLAADAGGCWLRVWVGNTAAIAFYERAGFAVVGEGTYAVGSVAERILFLERPTPSRSFLSIA